MSLKLNLGPATVDVEGDLKKYLPQSIDSMVHFHPALLEVLDVTVAKVPVDAISAGFKFSTAPSWTVPQQVGLTLSVSPSARCAIRFLKPNDVLFKYTTAPDTESAVDGKGSYYVAVELQCSLVIDAGARWSSGNFGVSGNISTNDKFRVANYCRVNGTAKLRDAIVQAFSSFVLPFQSATMASMPDGNYLDFDFVGNLSLGFGVTYGFSGLFLGGVSNGEVKAAFDSPIGKMIVSAAPSFSVGAEFKLAYSHADAFRVVVGRVQSAAANGATLYLLRRRSDGLTTRETFGITLNANAKFQADKARLKAEVHQATEHLLSGAGGTIASKLESAFDSLAGDVNDSVNKLLAKGDGHRLALELEQSRSTENTALFIYSFDFAKAGLQGYDRAMRGDYASAITLDGVQLDPRSFVEQLYIQSAGLNLEFFNLAKYHDIATYIEKTDVFYVGARTFQVRDTVEVQAITGLFGHEREADLYFIGQCRNLAATQAVSEVKVLVRAVFIDRDNAGAFRETARTMNALGDSVTAALLDAYIRRNPHGAIRLSFEADATLFATLTSDDYHRNHAAPEPHVADARNYERFVATAEPILRDDGGQPADVFFRQFRTYTDWLAFNRVKTDEEGSTNTGDRLSEGNLSTAVWPRNYGPSDTLLRGAVQAYVLAGQHFMNFCDSLKHLAADVPVTADDVQYRNLLRSLAGLVRKEVSFPTYFLKPAVVAVVKLANAQLVRSGTAPNPESAQEFAIAFTAQPATMAAKQP